MREYISLADSYLLITISLRSCVREKQLQKFHRNLGLMKSAPYYLLLWIDFSSIFFTIYGQTTPTSCPYGCQSGFSEWYPGRCYKYIANAIPQTIAGITCLASGASVLVVDDAAEQLAVQCKFYTFPIAQLSPT